MILRQKKRDGRAGRLRCLHRYSELNVEYGKYIKYTVPYAIGNILLTAWGPVMAAMMA
jgi:hypothetical protein